MDPDLGVHYETVEDVSLGDTTRVYLSVGLDEESEHSEVLSLTSSTDEVPPRSINRKINKIKYFFQLLTEQPLNLVKNDRRRKTSSLDGKSDSYLCKLCNTYISKPLEEAHNRSPYYYIIIIGYPRASLCTQVYKTSMRLVDVRSSSLASFTYPINC